MPNRRNVRASYLLTAACMACSMFTALASAQQVGPVPAGTKPPAPPAIDPQKVLDQDDMKWDDYRPIPGKNWADAEKHKPSERTIRIALVAADFPDHPFVMTMPKGSDLFGNPQIDPVKREEISKFYVDFWNGQSPAHHGHTVNEYWMEQSHGKIGVSFTPFGPYKMPRKSFQYGLSGFGAGNLAPADSPTGGNMQGELDSLWTADAGDVRSQYNLVLRMYAGYDETCVWQEFGEMKFQDRNSIPAEWGPPDPTITQRRAPTRYTPWTSWKAASYLWSNSSIIQGECSGSIVHEVSHAAFSIGDNNNNPYVTPYRRVGAGCWDIMDRGSFNGPGGPHNRWQIPVVLGGAMPAGILLRNKIRFGFVTNDQILRLSRDGLAKSGVAVANVIARSAEPGPGALAGIVIALDGEAVALPAGAAAGGGRGRGGGGDEEATFPVIAGAGAAGAGGPPAGAGRGGAPGGAPPGGGGRGGAGGRGGGRGGTLGGPTPPAGQTYDYGPWVDPATNPLSEGIPNFNNYTLEVVQRVGYDSFCPDSGVIIGKNREGGSTNGGPNGFACFNWIIDAHPEDMNKIDFKRPNGEVVMRTAADYRQLNDCLFHAGTNSGSQYEWVDKPNKLHFYVIDMKKDERGFLNYTLAVRSLDGAGPHVRDVRLAAPAGDQAVAALHTRCELTLTNAGRAAPTDAAIHPQDTNPYLASDVYRLEASIDGVGWSADLTNALAAVKFGDSQKIPVFVSHNVGASGVALVTVKATSESDPTKTTTATFRVTAR